MTKPKFGPPEKKSGIYWRKIDFMPYFYGFCPNEKIWHQEMKRFNMHEAYPTSDGACTPFINEGAKGTTCSIITLNHKPRTPIGVIALITHECMHAFQQMCKCVGENDASREFEAYAMQHMVADMVMSYEESRGKILVTRHGGKISL